MTDNDLGLVLQALGGACWIAAFFMGFFGLQDLPYAINYWFGTAWFATTSFFLARAGQNEDG